MKFNGVIFFVVGMLVAIALGWFVNPNIFYTSESQPVEFSHAVHTDSVGQSCQDCHGFTEDGAFAGIPKLEQCAGCHSEVTGTTDAERLFVEEYVKKNREVPWLVFSRQPDNAYFSHIYHVNNAKIECARCHGQHGSSSSLRPLQVNIITGYSRNVEGSWNSGMLGRPSDGMKMSDCIDCHNEHAHNTACIDCHK